MTDGYGIDRVFIIVTAVCLVLFGIFVFLDPVFVSRKYGVQINFGPYHTLIGIGLAVCGAAILYAVLNSRRKRRPD